MTTNLTAKTVQGVSWAGFSQALRTILQLGIIAVIARLLTPEDFGLVAMVVVFTNFIMIFRDFGLSAALIQRRELHDEHLSSCFWMNVFVGLFLSFFIAALAPGIAFFYNDQRLVLITIILGSTFFISSFGIVQSSLFLREIQFKILAIVEITAVLVSGITAIALAAAGFGVWSLVWQQVVLNAVFVILLWSLSRWRPQFFFRWQRVKEFLGFGLNLTGFNFVNYFNRNLDNLLIGKFLGSTPLGFYNLAYRILLFPIGNISWVIGRVMFPSLSAIQDDKIKVRNAYIKATRYIAILSFPLMLGILIVAPQFVRVIFGAQWERSISLIQILAVIGLIQSVQTSVGWIYQSQARTDIMFKWGILTLFVYAASFILGLKWNVEGVAIAYAIAVLLLSYPCFAIPFRLINLRISYFIKQFKSIILASISMGGTVLLSRYILNNTYKTTDLILLLLSVLVAVGSYAVFLFLFERGIYRETFRLLKNLKPASADIAFQPYD
jgi:O-antigen/teichoic acid export membrane protein